MLDELQSLTMATRDLVVQLDPARLDGAGARRAVRAFAELEKLAAAGKVLAAGRLSESGAGTGDDTFRDLESWLAALSGTSVGAAMGTLGTARRVAKLPAIAAALRTGALSPAQADVVSAAAKADPSSERSLLETAGTAGMRGLKAECDRVTAAAISRQREAEIYERIRNNRAIRHRTLPDGTGAIDIRGPVDRTAAIMAGIEPLEKELFDDNRAAKRVEHPDAVAFDALVTLTERYTRITARDGSTEVAADSREDDSRLPGDERAPDGQGAPAKRRKPRSRGGRPLAMLVFHVSHTAYERGWTEPGEICEIEGIGPVPVSVARRLAADSIMKAVVIDGVDVTRVAHLGRSIPAHLRTAVETRDRVCVIAGCEVERHLQIDHNIPVATRGPTSLANLGRLCHYHHGQKTLHDLRRIGPLGRQRLVSREEYERTPTRAGRAPPRSRAA